MIVVVVDHTFRVRVHRIALVTGDGDTVRARLWLGRAWGHREVRWSHTARIIPRTDVLRPATQREIDLGRMT